MPSQEYDEQDSFYWDLDDDDPMIPDCLECGDTGLIVAADGYHEYLGYDYLPCQVCSKGLGK